MRTLIFFYLLFFSFIVEFRPWSDPFLSFLEAYQHDRLHKCLFEDIEGKFHRPSERDKTGSDGGNATSMSYFDSDQTAKIRNMVRTLNQTIGGLLPDSYLYYVE